MALSTPIFLFVFLPFALAGYYLIKIKFSKIFLLIISLLFYAWGEPVFVLVLCASIFVNYILALLIDRFQQRQFAPRFLIVLSLVCNVGLLFVFKYLATTIKGINFVSGSHFTVLSLTLPLGISFFTFRAISYMLDVYFQTSKAQKNILNVALYISFFPQLMMGPILKYRDFEQQIQNHECTLDKFSGGAKRFITGFAKKVILADSIGIIVDKAFGQPTGNLPVLLGWLGIIAYLFQLYYDFSGYTDMAIGLSNMFGFDCAENFDYPYIAKSIGEFWRRWHITLGAWLKDYLYTPTFRIIMTKKIPFTQTTFSIQQCDIIALFVTWVVCGMWHGAGIKFLVYGMYYFVFIAGERLLQARKKRITKEKRLTKHEESKLEAAGAHIYALIAITFGQLIFRSSSLSSALSYAGSMFGLHGNPVMDGMTMFLLNENTILLLIALLFCFPIANLIGKFCESYNLT